MTDTPDRDERHLARMLRKKAVIDERIANSPNECGLLLVLTGVLPDHLLTSPLRELLFQAVFQGWGSVVISGITFTRMIQHYGPVRSTMITALVPGLSAFGAVVFLGEPLQWNLLAGLALVTLGILFGVQLQRKVAA